MSTGAAKPLDVLARALDQTARVLGEVRPEHLDRPTPCREWTVRRLVAHLVADPGNFVTMMRGGQPDWDAELGSLGSDPAGAFRSAAEELMVVWREQDASAVAGADWQTAEFAVHTWDLARGLGRPTDDLDPEVATRGLDFMRQGLTPENRGRAFAAEQPAPPDAPVYERLAAFAGREV